MHPNLTKQDNFLFPKPMDLGSVKKKKRKGKQRHPKKES